MLALKQIATTVCPPDKFTYRFPQDGYVAEAMCVEEWFAAIDKHYKDNEYEQPANWKQLAEDALCRRLSGEWCQGGSDAHYINTRFTFEDFLRGSKVLASFALGDGVVSESEANERARICSMCTANVALPGCSTCNALSNLIGEMKGSKSTQYDHLLKACGVCHCPNSVQVWVKSEHLAKGVTPEMMETYKTFSDCWKREALEKLNAP